MRLYANLQAAASVVAELDAALESLSLCANFLRRKLADPAAYPSRSVEELTAQFLDAEERLAKIHRKARGVES